MEEPEDYAPVNTNPKQSVPCEECKLNPSKYKCPGCLIRSCSLPCVKAHKQRTGCTGKRQQTQFVPLSQFDDNLLLSDYNLLEDVKRVAESAQRMRFKLCGRSQFRLPLPLKSLRNAAASRKTKLLILSSGMSKRETNRTYYNYRKKFISWTIEWQFHSTDVVLIDHGIHENTNLSSVVEKHLRPGPWNHKLRQFCDEHLESLKFFIRKYPKGPKSPFRQLDIRGPLKEQLANLVILEYPVIHVFLPSQSYDFEVMKDGIPQKTAAKEPASNNLPSPKGMTFREEEIEDGISSDPQILDLAKKELEDKTDRPLLERVASQGTKEGLENDVSIVESQDNLQSSVNAMLPGVLEGMDFDFDFDFDFDSEQGSQDANSCLIAQGNAGSLHNLKDMFPEEEEVDVRGDCLNLRGYIPVEEELEEGEISGF